MLLQNYHLDADNNVVPVAGTGSPLIAPNQMSRAKVWTGQTAHERGVHAGPACPNLDHISLHCQW